MASSCWTSRGNGGSIKMVVSTFTFNFYPNNNTLWLPALYLKFVYQLLIYPSRPFPHMFSLTILHWTEKLVANKITWSISKHLSKWILNCCLKLTCWSLSVEFKWKKTFYIMYSQYLYCIHKDNDSIYCPILPSFRAPHCYNWSGMYCCNRWFCIQV